MGDRGTALDVELQIPPGGRVFPINMGEFGDNIQGLLEIVDGNIKYKIKDQIKILEEIETNVNIHRDQIEFKVMEEWADSDEARDVSVFFKDSAGNVVLQFVFLSCQCNKDKKNAYDRKSKSEDMRKYFLVPKDIELIE